MTDHAAHRIRHDSREAHEDAAHSGRRAYGWLAVELSIDFAIMYLVMYTMIDRLEHFHPNLNNVYMTLMMVMPMGIVMLVFMRSMFPSRKANVVLVAGAAIVFLASFAGMRTQAAVGDEEFLKSMIPHHSGAILMCQEASLTDPELIDLCDDIVRAQEAEIRRMEEILARR
jgi:hypothetical protein